VLCTGCFTALSQGQALRAALVDVVESPHAP